MTTREDFEKWFADSYGIDISIDRAGEGYIYDQINDKWIGYQACAAHYEAELLKRDALIAEKDKALREVIEMYVDDANDADPEESVGAFAKQAISITNDNVRLVPVKWQTYDHDDGEWFTFDTEEEAKEVWPNNNIRRQLYTIVKGEAG